MNLLSVDHGGVTSMIPFAASLVKSFSKTVLPTSDDSVCVLHDWSNGFFVFAICPADNCTPLSRFVRPAIGRCVDATTRNKDRQQ